MFRTVSSMFFCSLLIFAQGCSVEQEQHPVLEADEESIEESLRWVAYIDDNDYAQSYEETGNLFKSRVSKDQWIELVSGAREPFGALKNRDLQDAKTAKQLPGAPDGSYVTIRFRSSFENKQNSVETFVLTIEDGDWKVVGYFIR